MFATIRGVIAIVLQAISASAALVATAIDPVYDHIEDQIIYGPGHIQFTPEPPEFGITLTDLDDAEAGEDEPRPPRLGEHLVWQGEDADSTIKGELGL
jgi:hypothetical protein